tara:strand:+ start:2118 stop:2645 length:528 start_codon:yes stop_codon:yes gene_type:complete
MCSVAWCSFSWEAFATLTTGLLAVGGAIVIAKLQMHILTRQTEIADRQTDIAAGQAELERVKLRSELFDRRAKVVDATRAWFHAFNADGHIPLDERNTNFREAIAIADFLFRPAVAARLRVWHDLGLRHHLHRTRNDHDAAHAVALQILTASNEVTQLFEPEMRLGEALPQAEDN